MEIGKLTNEQLNNYIFKNIDLKRKEVIRGGGIGADTSVMDFESDLIVASTDPITGADKNLGILSINVATNDIACQGAEPVGILLSVLIPPDSSLEQLNEIVIEANEECNKLNLDIIGGHTEVTDAVNKIIITATAIGRVKKDNLLDHTKIDKDDIVAISKYIAIEGSSIIYNSKKKELKKFLTEIEIEELEHSINLLSVLEEAEIAVKYGVKHMHDITEGGIYGALTETCKLIGKNIVINKEDIPVKDSALKIADYFKLDVYRLISSGSMIFIMPEKNFNAFKEECKSKGILVTKIGKVREGENLTVVSQEGERVLSEISSDELYRVL
ncbi:hydrogenase maturation factor [Peptoniphilus sp. ING2-D1G]|nr:hydrogenase maturation factor [Peptoniphilus sp. ING2-D1G]